MSNKAVAVLRISLERVEGLDSAACEGKKIFIAWKRGSKSGNSGKSDRLVCRDGASPIGSSFGCIELRCSLRRASSGWDAKYLSLQIKRLDESTSAAAGSEESRKRRMKSVTLGKLAIDLAQYADRTEATERLKIAKTNIFLSLRIQCTLTEGKGHDGAAKSDEGALALAESRGSEAEANDAASKDAQKKKKKRGSKILSRTGSKLFGKSKSLKRQSSRGDGASSSHSTADDNDTVHDDDDDDDSLDTDNSYLDSSLSEDTTAGQWSDEDEVDGDGFGDDSDGDREVPLLVQDMIALLSQSAAQGIQGLFQLPTHASIINNVTNMYKANVAVSDDWTEYTVAANVLKTALFQREEPLLPAALIPSFVAAMHSSDAVAGVKSLLSTLPPRTSVLLNVVTELLWKLARSTTNRMSAHNISNILLDAYYRADGAVLELKQKLDQMSQAVELVEFFVHNYDALFRPIVLPAHSTRRMLPSAFAASSAGTAQTSDRTAGVRRSDSRRLSLSLLGSSSSGQSSKAVKYDYRLVFKGVHDLMDVLGSASTPTSGGQFVSPVRVSIRWRRGKKSKNHGSTLRCDIDSSSSTRIVNFPSDTGVAFKVSMFRSPKGVFCSKTVDFEIVYERDGKVLATMAAPFDLAEPLNVAEASGDASPVVATEVVLAFPSLTSKKAPPTKLLMAIRARDSRARHHRNDSSSSLLKRLSSRTDMASSPAASSRGGIDNDVTDLDEVESAADVSMYITIADTIATHQNDEVYLQDWMTVLHPVAPAAERRWCALTKETLIIFKPPTPGVSPKPSDPRDAFDTASMTEIEYGRSDVEFSLGTPVGTLAFTADSRKKRDEWVSELRRVILLAKQEAGRVLRMSAAEARRLIDRLTAQLQEAEQKLEQLQAELKAKDEASGNRESTEIEALRKKVKKYRGLARKAQSAEKEQHDAVTTLRGENQLSMQELELRLTQSKDAALAESETSISGLRGQLAEQQQRHQQELAKLESSLKQEIAAIQVSSQQLAKDHEQSVRTMQTQHDQRLATLHSEHQQLVQTMKNHAEAELKEFASKSTASDSLVRKELGEQLQRQEALLQQLKIDHAAAVNASKTAKEEFDVSVQLLRKEHDEKLSKLQTEHQAAITEVQGQMDKDSRTRQQQLDEALRRVAEHESTVANLETKLVQTQTEHAALVEQLKSSHQESLRSAVAKKEEELATVRQQLAAEKDELANSLRETVRTMSSDLEARTSEHQTLVTELEAKHQLSLQERQTAFEALQANLQALQETHAKKLGAIENESLASQRRIQVQLESQMQLQQKAHDQLLEERATEHAKTVEELRAQHQKALQVVQEQLGKQQGDVVAQLQAQVTQLTEAHAKELARVEEDRRQQLEQLTELHRKEREESKTATEQQLVAARAEQAAAIGDAAREHQAEIERLEKEREEAVADAKRHEKTRYDSKLEEFERECEQKIKESQQEHSSQRTALEKSHAQEVQSLQSRMDLLESEQTSSLVELQATIDDLRQQVIKQQAVIEDTQNQGQRQLHQEKLRHEEELLKAKRAQEAVHAEEITRLQAQLGQTQGAVVQDLTETIDNLRRQHASEVDALHAQAQENLATVRSENEREVAVLTTKHSESETLLEQRIASLQAKAKEAKKAAEQEVQELRASIDTLTEEHRAELERMKQQLDSSADLEELRRALKKCQSKLDKRKKKIEELRRRQRDQETDYELAQKSQYEIRKLFFAKHSWDDQMHLLDAKKLYQMWCSSDSFNPANTAKHKLLESTIENIVDVAVQNQRNLGLIAFYASFSMTLLDLLQNDNQIERVSQTGVSPMHSKPTTASSSSSSDSSNTLTWRRRSEDEDVREWLIDQLQRISSHLVLEFFIPTAYSTLDELAVVSIVFSEQYAIFEASRSSKTPGEDLTVFLTEIIGHIEENHLFLVVAEAILAHLFYRVDSQVFNTLMQSNKDDVVTTRRGFQIKIALSEIDSWLHLQTTSGSMLSGALVSIARQHLQHMRAACVLLVTATNESMFTNQQLIEEMFAPLTPAQIYRLLQRYRPEPSSPEPVPESVLRMFERNSAESKQELTLPLSYQHGQKD